MKTTFQSIRIYIVLTLLTGIIYPLAMTGVAQILFPKQANGSRIVENGKLLGSELLVQKFESPRYFWPRPSAADFATVASGASNKGPTSADLKKRSTNAARNSEATHRWICSPLRAVDLIRTSARKQRGYRFRESPGRATYRSKQFQHLSIKRSSHHSSDSSANHA